jgi:drug/metabolite transporter (DMT)-like permease
MSNIMDASQIYIVISVIVLAVIALLLFFVGKKKGKKDKKLTPLAGLAFAFIIAGIIFGDDRLIGYSLIGIGVVIAIIDMVKKLKSK